MMTAKKKNAPKDLTTTEGCLAAVQENGHALQFVPESFKTPELNRIAESE